MLVFLKFDNNPGVRYRMMKVDSVSGRDCWSLNITSDNPG